MDKLPLELGEFIFQYVGYKQQLYLAKGRIDGFISAVLALNLNFRIFQFPGRDDTREEMEICINAFPLIQDFTFCHNKTRPYHFEGMGLMSNLRKLYIECDTMSNEDIGYISRGQSGHLLEDLSITFDKTVTNREFSNLRYFSNLKRVYIFDDDGSATYIDALCTGRSYHTLENLALAEMNDADCKAITELPALRKLELCNGAFTDRGFKTICNGLLNLESLMLVFLQGHLLTDGLKAIASLLQLKKLYFEELQNIDITVDCLSTIGQNCTSLEELTINGDVDVSGTVLQNFPNLKQLRIGDASMDDIALNIICTKMVSLEKLDLDYCFHITADAFSMIENLQKLKILSVTNTAINDKSISAILTIPTLWRLRLPRRYACTNKLMESHHFKYNNGMWSGRRFESWTRM